MPPVTIGSPRDELGIKLVTHKRVQIGRRQHDALGYLGIADMPLCQLPEKQIPERTLRMVRWSF